MTDTSSPNPTRTETYHAVVNGLKLIGSLSVTFAITIAVRQFLIPRSLGTERFGELNFADGFSQVFMVVAWLGVDTWLRKELGVTLPSAEGVLGGILAVRTAFAVVLTAAMLVVLKLLGRSNEILLLAGLFAAAQLMVMCQHTASALLHSAGKVGGLSISNIVGKLLWAAIVIPALVYQLPTVWLAAAFLISETFKVIASTYLAKHHLRITLAVDLKAAWAAIKGGLPFWVNLIAIAGTGRADVAVAGTLAAKILGSHAASDREIGWYTLVLGIGGILFSVAPVVGWILVPLLSRAVKRGQDEASAIIRRALEVCVVCGVPVSVGTFVAAEEIIALYKPEYLPSVRVLRIMACTFVLTYINVVSANCLMALGKGWMVTWTSLTTLFLTPLLDLFLVPQALERFGPGGGAAACALAVLISETLTTAVMLRNLGRQAFDRRLLSAAARTLLTAAGTVGIDWVLRHHIGLHPWVRVGASASVYVTLALLTRSVAVSDVKALLQLARSMRASSEAPSA